jgi:hypothetical protein
MPYPPQSPWRAMAVALTSLHRPHGTARAPQREPMVPQASQAPCAPHLGPTSPPKTTAPTRRRELPTSGRDDALAPAGQRLTCRTPDGRRQTFLGPGRRLPGCGCRRLRPLAGRGAGRRNAAGRQGRGGHGAGRTARPRRRDRLPLPRRVPRWRPRRRLPGLPERRAQRCRRRWGVRRRRHVAGHHELLGPRHPGGGLPTGVPPLGVRRPAGPRGSRAAPRGLVSRWLRALVGRLAPPGRAAPPARGVGRTAARAFGVCGGLGCRGPPPPGRRNVGPARRASGSRRGARIPPTAPSRGLCGLLLLRGGRHPRRAGLPSPRHGCLHRTVTPRRVTCRMPRDGRPLGRPVAPLHPPRRPCDTPHRHTQRLAGLARQRAPVPAGATVRAGRAAEGPKGHRPCTGQRALTARTPPPHQTPTATGTPASRAQTAAPPALPAHQG